MHWRRKWQPTPVFLPGEFQGRGSLVGCRLCEMVADMPFMEGVKAILLDTREVPVALVETAIVGGRQVWAVLRGLWS